MLTRRIAEEILKDDRVTTNHESEDVEIRIQEVYFIGIGGIGMSALARYFHSRGTRVSGYDKTERISQRN